MGQETKRAYGITGLCGIHKMRWVMPDTHKLGSNPRRAFSFLSFNGAFTVWEGFPLSMEKGEFDSRMPCQSLPSPESTGKLQWNKCGASICCIGVIWI